ncbi:MAG: MaoC family dehydratase N-terminal domain-containing protein [Deltaproteobacteria bacterium]|nr:MaoC family dehydratase N-terminal domain-containing protein [Deltaproteobacteria bacterium]
MPFNPASAGKSYPSNTVRVQGESIEQFIRALGENNPYFVDPKRRGGVIAPPLYAARLAIPALARAVADPELGVPAEELIPVACELNLARPVRPGRDVVLSAGFGDIEQDERGEVISLRLQGTRRLGVLVFLYELRLLHPRASGAPAPPPPATHFLRPPLAFRARYTAIAPSCMGEAGGAAPSIPPDALLSPFLGLAHAARTVIDTSLKRDPSQLKRIRVRPVRPVEAGEPLTVAGWIIETRRATTFMGFEILGEDGGLVMAEGVAEVILK